MWGSRKLQWPGSDSPPVDVQRETLNCEVGAGRGRTGVPTAWYVPEKGEGQRGGVSGPPAPPLSPPGIPAVTHLSCFPL